MIFKNKCYALNELVLHLSTTGVFFIQKSLFLFQVALSYKNQILGYIDSYIARTRYLVISNLSKSYHIKHITISQTQFKDEASQIYRKLQNVLPSLNRITAQENVLSDRNNDKLD